MRNWSFRLAALLAVAYVGYEGYVTYNMGILSRPELPPNTFSLSYKSGFRAIIEGEDQRDNGRKYLAFSAADVPNWHIDSWSFCRKMSNEELSGMFGTKNTGPGFRWEGVCEIDLDGEPLTRGWIGSVPDV